MHETLASFFNSKVYTIFVYTILVNRQHYDHSPSPIANTKSADANVAPSVGIPKYFEGNLFLMLIKSMCDTFCSVRTICHLIIGRNIWKETGDTTQVRSFDT